MKVKTNVRAGVSCDTGLIYWPTIRAADSGGTLN